MLVKDLLPILPRYPDDSGYDVKINYCNYIRIYEKRTFGSKKKEIKESMRYGDVLFHEDLVAYSCKNLTYEEILNCEVEKITGGKSLIGGDYDYKLQIWLSTTRFAIINDERLKT